MLLSHKIPKKTEARDQGSNSSVKSIWVFLLETAHRVHGLQSFLGIGLLNHVLSEIQASRGSVCAVDKFKHLLFKQLAVFDAQVPLLELVVHQGNILIDI